MNLTPYVSMVETQNIAFSFVNIRGLSQVRNVDPTVAVVVDGVLQTTSLPKASALGYPQFKIPVNALERQNYYMKLEGRTRP